MKKRKRAPQVVVPVMLAEMAVASWETIARRSLMMAAGTCSVAEYRRMMAEKVHAARRSGAALTGSRAQDPVVAMLEPWHRGVTANARRLRRSRR